jgi:hypothetical protein
MAHKQIVDICNWQVETDMITTNWLPICVNGVQWYVAETSTYNNSTNIETTPIKRYKQGANGIITNTAPVGSITEGYCATVGNDVELLYGCETQTITILGTAVITSPTTTTLRYTNPNLNITHITPIIANYIQKVIVDWGDGTYDMVGLAQLGTGNINHTSNPSLSSGTYEGRVFVQTKDLDWFVINEFKYDYNQLTNIISGLVITQVGGTSINTVRNIVQVRNLTTNSITYTTDVGVITTLSGTNSFAVDCQKQGYINIIDNPYLSGNQSVLDLPNVVALENASQNRIIAGIAANTTTNTNPSFTGARDVTVYNSKTVTVAFEYTTTINGTYHRINIPANETWSNTLKKDDYSNEGTYVAGRIITAYGATTDVGEININWTT